MNEPDEFIGFLQGEQCRAVILQEFWHHGAPTDLVNVVFLQVGSDKWARFFFDAGVFFWHQAAPQPVDGGEPAFEYRLVDTGSRFQVKGQRIVRVEFTEPDPDCARLLIGFERGTLILDNAEDHTRLAFVEAMT